MERMGHSTNNMLKNVYQHTMNDKAVAVADAVDGFFEFEFHLQFICKNAVFTESILQLSQVMRKQESQKALVNTRKTPQSLKLRGFFHVRWLQFGYFASTVSGIKSHIFINDFGVLFS